MQRTGQEAGRSPMAGNTQWGRALGPGSYHPAAAPHSTLLILNAFPKLNIHQSVMVVAHYVSSSPTGRGGKEGRGRWKVVPKDGVSKFWVGTAFQTTFISQGENHFSMVRLTKM